MKQILEIPIILRRIRVDGLHASREIDMILDTEQCIPLFLGILQKILDMILGALAGGMSYQEVCEDYEVTEEDIKATLEYATKLVANEEIHILEAI